MPKDPKQLMALAANKNSLFGSDVQPWHLKASYKLLNDKGNSEDEGTIEELWAGPNKAWLTYTGTKFSQTTYWTEDGQKELNAASDIPELLLEMRQQLIEPLPNANFIQEKLFEHQERKVGNVTMTCAVFQKPKPSPVVINGNEITYCFDSAKPILRLQYRASSPWATQSVRNKIVIFQGRYLPEDIRFFRDGKCVMTASVDSIELLKAVDPLDVTPPAAASPSPARVVIPDRMANELKVEVVPPIYPPQAKEARVQGTVVLHVVIGKDGGTSDIQVLSGPPMLTQAATNAVKQWVYVPYTQNGQILEMETTVNVIFNLAN